jgi:hypothetical protein
LRRTRRSELEAQAKFLLAVDDIFDLEGLQVGGSSSWLLALAWLICAASSWHGCYALRNDGRGPRGVANEEGGPRSASCRACVFFTDAGNARHRACCTALLHGHLCEQQVLGCAAGPCVQLRALA